MRDVTHALIVTLPPGPTVFRSMSLRLKGATELSVKVR